MFWTCEANPTERRLHQRIVAPPSPLYDRSAAICWTDVDDDDDDEAFCCRGALPSIEPIAQFGTHTAHVHVPSLWQFNSRCNLINRILDGYCAEAERMYGARVYDERVDNDWWEP